MIRWMGMGIILIHILVISTWGSFNTTNIVDKDKLSIRMAQYSKEVLRSAKEKAMDG